MNNTFILFEDRKAEIEFYYSIILPMITIFSIIC